MRSLMFAGSVCALAVSAPAQLTTRASAGPGSLAPFSFVDVTDAVGILPHDISPGMVAGVAIEDFDQDGDLDIFVPTASGQPHQLYRNTGNGTFEEIGAAVGLNATHNARTAMWVDADGDGRLDLVVLGDCFSQSDPCLALPTAHLYLQQSDGTFVDATIGSGLENERVATTGQHRGGATAGDLDGDGRLDLVFGLWGGQGRVFLGSGAADYSDVSVACGLGGVTRGHWQPIVHDFNGDGLMDVFWAIDFIANNLWINNGLGSFVDRAAEAGVNYAFNDMGVAVGDPDNDGDIDIYITEVFNSEIGRFNPLLRNDSVGDALSFATISHSAGVDNTDWGWGTTMADLDDDGWTDLIVTNGFFNPPFLTDRSRIFRNSGESPIRYDDVSISALFHDSDHCGTILAFDMDRDGDMDIAQVSMERGLRIYRNTRRGAAVANHWVTIRPRMPGTNHWAIGAVVKVEAGGVTRTRLITVGVSCLGQEPAEAHFGLGGAATVDRVTIDWPDGTTSVVDDLGANTVWTIEQQ
ncbi:MAG: CRTAC1 family protein [Phycisphaeraceae bacterium]|nr:CRTAC1 family protein [Phycisphaeraceae bacterium]